MKPCPICRSPVYPFTHTPMSDHPDITEDFVECTNNDCTYIEGAGDHERRNCEFEHQWWCSAAGLVGRPGCSCTEGWKLAHQP